MDFFAPRLEEALRKNFPGFFSEIAPASDEADVLSRLAAYCRDTGIQATQEELGTYAITFYAVNLWRKYRTIYRLDPTVGEMLTRQASESDLDSGLPADLLLNLPLPCISIEAPPSVSAPLRIRRLSPTAAPAPMPLRPLMSVVDIGTIFGLAHGTNLISGNLSSDGLLQPLSAADLISPSSTKSCRPRTGCPRKKILTQKED